jgi:hypothetical protein
MILLPFLIPSFTGFDRHVAVMIQLVFLRWARALSKAYESERPEFSYRFRSTEIISWFGRLFVLLAGEFFVPFAYEGSIYLTYSSLSVFLKGFVSLVSVFWPDDLLRPYELCFYWSFVPGSAFPS